MKIQRLFLTAGLPLIFGMAASCTYYNDEPVPVDTVYQPGYAVSTLPPGYRTEVINGVRYYRHDHVYYRPEGSGYVVVETPRTIVDAHPGASIVRTLPGGYEVVTYRGQRYYRSGNVYYQSRGDGYAIVPSPY